MGKNNLPFAGIRVCDFSWVAAGPVATKVLADFGAEVIKMESSTHPDIIRIAAPKTPGKEQESLNVSGWFNNQNSSKMCLGLNLKHPRAKSVYDRLILASDIVFENFSPTMKDRLGLNYEHYAKQKPDLIWVDQPMQGLTGPRRNRAGFGQTITPSGGLSHVTGFPNRRPTGTGTNYTDYVVNSGQTLFTLLAALRQRKKTGKGRHIVMAQVASSATVLETAFLDYTVNGRILEKNGNRIPHAAPHGCYRCKGEDRPCLNLIPRLGATPGTKSDRWCVITVFNDEHWKAFCKVIGNPQWTRDDKFTTLLSRKKNEDELDELVTQWTLQRPPEEVMLLMQQAGVPAGVVQDGEDVLVNDPHLKSRNHYIYLDHPETGRSAYDSFAYHLSETPGKLSRPAPRLGEHTEYVCKEVLGMDDEEFTDLLVEEVIEIG
jgi:benzylsuccinate CoA-transferase BbsF subunit